MHVLSSNIRHNLPPQTAPQLACRGSSSFAEFRNVLNIVAATYGVDPTQVLDTSRRRADIALCRHIAMYVAHVSLGYTLTRTGNLFNRDRTTVSHACARIEDMRDDREFDEVLTSLEQVLSFARISKSAACKRFY